MIDFQLFSCEKKVLTKKVSSLLLPAQDGDIEILSGYTPSFHLLKPGLLKYQDLQEEYLFIFEGVAFIDNETATIMTSKVFIPESPYSDLQQALKDFEENYQSRLAFYISS